MAIGIVKWFNDAEGFGFIRPAGGGEDIFVHHSVIYTEGYPSLREGERVEYEAVRESDTLHATSVRLIDEAKLLKEANEMRVRVKFFDFSHLYVRIKKGEEKDCIVETMINKWAAKMQRRILNTSMTLNGETLFVMVTHEPMNEK